MNVWKYGGRTYLAWSVMECGRTDDHEPHTWSGQGAIYGPYLCWGLPHQGPKHRKAGAAE